MDIEKGDIVFEGEALVCEDNMMNSDLICRRLNRMGLKTTVAVNGREGVEAVRHRLDEGKTFDLIFMDINMPVMNGTEAAAEITGLSTGIPVIAFTSQPASAEMEHYKSCGMTGFLNKPFKMDELRHCLLEYLAPAGQDVPEADDSLRQELVRQFIGSSLNNYNEIAAAIDEGDIATAHRIAHNLKSNAMLIGEGRLSAAAGDIEKHLKGRVNEITPMELQALQNEFGAALERLMPEVERTAAPVTSTGFINTEQAITLLEELRPLLDRGNPDCLDYIGRLRGMKGSEGLIKQMENYNFALAKETLSIMVKEWK